MTDGMRYIGIGEYGVFEDDLKELMEAKVIVSVANELGLFDGVDFGNTLAELYPGKGETPWEMSVIFVLVQTSRLSQIEAVSLSRVLLAHS